MTSCVLTVVSRSHEPHHSLLRDALNALRSEMPDIKIRRSRKKVDVEDGIYVAVRHKRKKLLERLTELLFEYFKAIGTGLVVIVQRPHGVSVKVFAPA